MGRSAVVCKAGAACVVPHMMVAVDEVCPALRGSANKSPRPPFELASEPPGMKPERPALAQLSDAASPTGVSSVGRRISVGTLAAVMVSKTGTGSEPRYVADRAGVRRVTARIAASVVTASPRQPTA